MASLLVRSAGLITALVLLPIVLGDFWAFNLSTFFLYAIAALGIGICWGQAGFLPLGQSMFVGIGAYLAGGTLIHYADGWIWPLMLVGAAVVPGVLAYVLGLIVFRGRTESGPYFALITLALTLLAYQIANTWRSVTGGFNGLKNIPAIPGLGDFSDNYYVAATALLVGIAIAAWLIHAPIGVLWRALAGNERRVAFFGFDTTNLKALAFGVSGVLAGMAGAIYAPQQGLVTPELCGFLFAADLLVWAAVGGRSSLLGPVLGVMLIGTLTFELKEAVRSWEIFLAAIFIVVVLYVPSGIAGLFMPLERLLPRPRPRQMSIMAPSTGVERSAATLDIREISASIGEVHILDDLRLALERPAIYCLIGPNGAGKTSTFNVLTGELAAQHGEVRLDGAIVRNRAAHRMALAGVGRKFQIPSVFVDLSVADNLHIALWGGRASLLDLLRPRLRRWTSPLLQTLQKRYPFLEDGTRTARELSHGERQILELVMALIAEPRLLLLDEPCAGLSPDETRQVIDVVRWARATLGLCIVIIEHDMALVKELAEHVFVMHQGRLLAEGDVAQIQADARVREVYVGVSE